MEWSDWGDDESEDLSPCSPPQDRAWRHPSELGLAGIGGETFGVSRRAPRGRVAFALVAASTSAFALYALASVTLHPASRSRTVGESARGSLFPSISSESSMLSSGSLRTFTSALTAADGVVTLVATIGAAEQRVSAIAVDDNGTLVTGSDAVNGAFRLESLDNQGHRSAITVIGTDATSGLTVLSSSHMISAATWTSCAGVAAGDLVHLGSGAGAVTARVAEVGLRADHDGTVVYPLIRLVPSAAFVGGGGDAVLDSTGRVVAIAIARQGDDVLAAPADVAMGLAKGVRRDGRATRPWLGVSGGDDNGAVVHAVTAGSPAAAAGLIEGDIIERVDDHAVGSMWAVVLTMQGHAVGDKVTVGVRRGQNLHAVTITLSERPANAPTLAVPTLSLIHI